jgi:hypothetical protein
MPSEKTQEQRIEDAAAVLQRHIADQDLTRQHVTDLAREMLDAAETPRVEWPTDESVSLVRRVAYADFEIARSVLRDAMLADPIIKEAVACRDYERHEGYIYGGAVRDVINAVNEAGL